jgi:hypothetical protein
MSFSVQAVQQGVGFDELVELWRFVDGETRFDGIFTMDHLVTPVEGGDLGARPGRPGACASAPW